MQFKSYMIAMKEKNLPRYEIIAYEIAKRIDQKELNEGDKIRGRSMLASEYNVSSETIRKSMRLLSNIGVVEVKERSGIYVLSQSAASLYIEQFKAKQKDHRLVQKTVDLLNEAKHINAKLEEQVHTLINSSKQDIFPFEFFTVILRSEDNIIDKRIKETRFNEETNGLIIAVEENDVFSQNPSSNIILKAGMILYILGDQTIKDNVINFINRT